MRKVRDVLRLKHTLGMSLRQISEATGVGKTVVGEYLRRAGVIGITGPVPEDIDDFELDRRLFPVPGDSTVPPRRYGRLLKTLARVELLILDDWGLATLTQDQGRDLLEIIDDRHNRGSTIVTSQLPVDHWHELIANPTVADAILDRLVHNAHRLTLNGDSMRKAAAKRSGLDASPAP
jgi:IstB-like ATP binding protein